MAKQAKIGLIGLGYWGKNILRNLYELGALQLACDLDKETIQQRKKQFPQLKYTASYEDLLKSSAIGAVAIATPAATHYELAKQALLAGKDVFVEKPLALSASAGRELIELAKTKKRILMVGHILQYHPAVIKLKEIIGQGDLGKVQYIYSNRLNIGKLRVEENILWSFAPHDISVILELIGEEPLRVDCFGADYLNQGIADVTMTTLEFKNKIKAHIFVSWLHPFKEQKLVVVGSRAMAVFDDMTKEKLFVYPHKIEWQQGKIPIAQKAERYPVTVASKEPLREEMRHFIDCLAKSQTPKTDGAEGLAVLKVLEQAEKSLRAAAGAPAASEDYFVHPSSWVDEGVAVGRGTKIWHFSHVLKDSKIGKNCVIGQNVTIGPDVKLGNNCKVQNNVSLYKAVTLEDDVFCGPSCVFTNVINPRSFIERKHEFKDTLVKKGATIGANATIICGNTLGQYCLIGAGAVVTCDVPDYALAVGLPARVKGWVCKCGVTLKLVKNAARCPACGSHYRLSKNKLKRIDKK